MRLKIIIMEEEVRVIKNLYFNEKTKLSLNYSIATFF